MFWNWNIEMLQELVRQIFEHSNVLKLRQPGLLWPHWSRLASSLPLFSRPALPSQDCPLGWNFGEKVGPVNFQLIIFYLQIKASSCPSTTRCVCGPRMWRPVLFSTRYVGPRTALKIKVRTRMIEEMCLNDGDCNDNNNDHDQWERDGDDNGHR